MKRAVQWSRDALDDLKGQIAYISKDNLNAAHRIADRIHGTATLLGEMATGRHGRVSGTFEKPVAGLPYTIAYTIHLQNGQESIFILRVIHAARNWPHDEWPK